MPEHDLILFNGRVITMDGVSRIAQSIVAAQGRIATYGSDADVAAAGHMADRRDFFLGDRDACHFLERQAG